MSSGGIDALHVGLTALVALVLLQIAWHIWLVPAGNLHLAPALALFVVPLLPGLWVSMQNLRRGVLIGGIVCLFYFCHGVSLAYGDSDARLPALAEVLLSLVVIGALGWDARKYKKKAAP
jgi:uncharacterized membrane protein